MEPFDDAALDALLREAAEAPAPAVSDALGASLVAAALAAQPQRGAVLSPPRGLWGQLRGLLGDLGGMSGLAGISAAGLVGLWIGLVPPNAAQNLLSPLVSVQAPVAATIQADDPFAAFEGGDLLSVMTLETEF